MRYNLDINNILLFKKMIKNKVAYSSFSLRSQRSNNSFALLSNQSYICISKFIVNRKDNNEYSIVKKVVVSFNHEDYLSEIDLCIKIYLLQFIYYR